MSFSKEEMDFLVYHYLQESGSVQSAALFSTETRIEQSNIDGANVPEDALISMVTKGLKYTKGELFLAHRTRKRQIEALSLIEAVKPDIAKKWKANNPQDGAKTGVKGNSRLDDNVIVAGWQVNKAGTSAAAMAAAAAMDTKSDVKVKEEPDSEQVENIIANSKTINVNTSANPTAIKMEIDSKPSISSAVNISQQQQQQMQSNSGELTANLVQIPQSRATILKGHKDEVNVCAWNPCNDTLASGSDDSTVRIWNINDPLSHTTLRHDSQQRANWQTNTSILSLDWNSDGSLLATGHFDGIGRIWTAGGDLPLTLTKHKEPIFAIKWSKNCKYVLTAADKTSIIWDSTTGACMQQFTFHKTPMWDVDWQSNSCFASCSMSTEIHVCRLRNQQPEKTFMGHKWGVNSVKWCPTGSLLASCSDDMTVKVWSLRQDTPVHNFVGHERAVNTIKWSNTGRGTANPNLNLMLASGSYDSAVRLWDVERGECLFTLMRHFQPVQTVEFSPDGRFLASGSGDRSVNIWSTQSGQLTNSYKSSGDIHEVCWNANGDRVAAAVNDGSVVVLDMRK